MVSSNILSLDEVSEDNTTNNIATTAHNHLQPQPRDDHNNPIVNMNEATLAADFETISQSIPATTTSEVPSSLPSFDTTINTVIENHNTLNTNYSVHSDNDNAYEPPRPSSAFSSGGDSDCASDITCENDDNITTIERSSKEEDDNSLPASDTLPKSMLIPNDILISHSTPVIVPQMATVPSRPFKSIRPTPKASVNPTAGKNVAQVSSNEEAKPTMRVLLLCQPSSHQFQTRNIVLEPNQEVKVGRSITRNRVTENNAIFDCKVLSRNHALIWMADGKFYIRDTASSNGTFVNEHRLSLTATPSKPYEVKTGDIVQFGVDVLENSYTEKHGCIITMLKFCTGNADTEDLKRASGNAIEDPRFMKLGNNQTGGRSLSSAELYRLNTFIQEAVQREQILESKLLSLQKIIDQTRKNSANVWQSMIEEDRLLSRIDILENKLQYFQKNFTDDKLRKEIIKLQDDKSVYQNSAKEALRKVYDDRNEAVMKLATIERALCSSEDECALLRNQLLKTQQNFKEVTVSLTQLEERDAKQQGQEQVFAQREAMTEQKLLELYEQIKLRSVECMSAKSALESVTKEKADLMERIEMYEKLSERISEAEEDEGATDDANNPVMRWLMGNKDDEKNNKNAITEKLNLNLSSKFGDIEKNLMLLESMQLKLKDGTSNEQDNSKITDEDQTTSNQHCKEAEVDEQSVLNDQPHVIQDTVIQLKDIFAELTGIVQSEGAPNPQVLELESQLSRCQHELTQLHAELEARPTSDAMTDKTKECDELRRQVIDLATTTEYLQIQLNKASLVLNPNCVDIHVQTDKPPMPEPTAAISTTSFNSACVQTEPSPELIVPQTTHSNGIHTHPDNGKELVVKVVHTQSALNAEAVTVLSPSTEYAEDIALLTDPNVLREAELITIKEQCSQLTEDNRQLALRVGEVSNRGDTAQIHSSIIWIFGVLILIIACLLGYLCF